MDSYDIPEALVADPRSPAFEKFLWNWFGNPLALSRRELDITFLKDLTPEELSTARELVRRNLPLKHTQLFDGAAALRDVEALPILKRMLGEETSLSWRLTISGALWRIDRDPVFIGCLEEAKFLEPSVFQWVHLFQVLWLDDERVVDFLVDLLDQKDRMARAAVLRLLNELESGQRMWVPAEKMPHQPADYRRLRNDPVFRAHMVEAIHRWNAESRNGR
jgi:hypothetical protein